MPHGSRNRSRRAPVPRIGSPAPPFGALTTHGEFRLEDCKGNRLVFFSHPADFTPVCATEFLASARVHEELRAIIHYPLTTGRNVDEIVRLVKALQTADEYAVATPANWKPGDKVIVPPPKTQERAEARVEETKQFDVTDWYIAEKAVDGDR